MRKTKKFIAALALCPALTACFVLHNSEDEIENKVRRCSSTQLAEGETGTFIDSSDNKSYGTVVINCQEWMAENYARVPANGKYWHADGDPKNDEEFGLLYDWETAAGICPEGWHLPRPSEFSHLMSYVGKNDKHTGKFMFMFSMNTETFMALIADRKAWEFWERFKGWEQQGRFGNQKLDAFGFGALPAGQYKDGSYGYFRRFASFWAATAENNSEYGTRMDVGNGFAGLVIANKSCGFSVRCVRD